MYICIYIYICNIMFTRIFTHNPCALYHLNSSPCLASTSLLLLSPLPLSSLLLSLPRVSHYLVSLLWASSRCPIMHPVELPFHYLPLSPALFLFFPSIIYPWELHCLSLSSSSLFLSLSLSFSLFYLSTIPLVSIPSSLFLLSLFAI